MPNLFEQFRNSQAKKTDPSIPPTHEEALESFDYENENRMKIIDPKKEMVNKNPNGTFDGTASGDPKENQARQNNQYANQVWGEGAIQNSTALTEDPDSWDPSYTANGFFADAGTSIMRGVGNHIVKGTGDMIQVLGGIVPGLSVAEGNMLSRTLQSAGEDFASKFKSFIPDELKSEELGWSALANPKFWSTEMAEMIPQLAEFILLSKGGSGLARKGASDLSAKYAGKGFLKNASKTAGGQAIPFTGRGVVGKLATDVGLTNTGNLLVGAVGGGVTGNLFSGMLNAAELVNQNKDVMITNDKGEQVRMYSDEDLGEMAATLMINNSAWLAFDVASWGMTYGGGWKGLKGLNPIAKGGKLLDDVQQLKLSGNIFSKSLIPVMRGLGNTLGKGAVEGFEETFQESFEEWAKIQAKAEVDGGNSELLNVSKFMDFYNSPENSHTKVAAFGAGLMGGTTYNAVSSLINKKADEALRLHDATENFKEIVKRQGSESEMKWQEFHKVNTMARIVAHDKAEAYDEFSQGLVENENITPEEKTEMDKMFSEFQELKNKGDRLNVKGTMALLHNKANEMFAQKQIEEFQALAKQNIEDYKAIASESPNESKAIQKKINDEMILFEKRMRAASLTVKEARQNINNLILGKKADPLNIKITYDEYGNEIVESGIASNQFEDYTSKDEFNKDGSVKAKKPSQKKNTSSSFKLSDLGEKGRAFYDKAMASITGITDEVKSTVDKAKEEYKRVLDEEENKNKDPKNDTEVEVEKSAEVDEEIDDLINDVVEVKTEEDPISDDLYNDFKENSNVPQSLIKDIANKIHSKEPLSTRENEIKASFTPEIRSAIADLMIGQDRSPVELNEDGTEKKVESTTDPKEEEAPIDDDTLSDKEKEFVQDETKKKELTPEQASELESKYNVTIQDGKVTPKSDTLKGRGQAFAARMHIARLLKNEKTAKTKQKANERKAKKEWNFDKSKTDNIDDIIGLDKRESPKSINVVSENVKRYAFSQSIISRIRNQNADGNRLSQNQLDNYLNLYQTYNLNGPTEIHSMVAVNHKLKKMFPDLKNKPQAVMVYNLYEAIGSVGLGHSLMMTMFIDQKSWNQDKVFMHEMSHIYYSLSEDEPWTQNLLRKAMSEPSRVQKIRDKYDDYTLYRFEMGDNVQELTKSQISQSTGLKHEELRDWIRMQVKSGILKTVPLSKQKYLKDELFADYLENPLADNLDKLFEPKEQLRQETARRWWSNIGKKSEAFQGEDNVNKLLNELHQGEIDGNIPIKDFIMNRFKAVTEGVQMDLFGLDSRADDLSKDREQLIREFAERKDNSAEPPKLSSLKEEIERNDILDDYDQEIEENGEPSYNAKDFSDSMKSTTRILRRFGIAYNKALRINNLRNNKGKVKDRAKDNLFDRDSFEAIVFNMATEIDRPNEFGVEIEQSAVREVQAFNNFLNKVHPEQKEQILSSMHFVLSNSKHVVGIRNNINNNSHFMESSMNQKEKTRSQNIMTSLKKSRESKSKAWNDFNDSVYNILSGNDTKQDYLNVVKALTNYDTTKLWEQGVITYMGNTIPIETLIAGFIRRGMIFNKDKSTGKGIPQKGIYYASVKPLVDALLDTNRKFTPLSSVFNAEDNMEPVRIVNNNLTKEIDGMIDFLSGKGMETTPTKEQFLKRYSHTAEKNKKEMGSRYVPNQLLENIYDNFERGILPTISQYHGIKDLNNKKGNSFKNSTSIEQAIEDLMTFVNTSRKPNGERNNSYLGNMGAFADSPRKFLMNMNLVKYEDLFDGEGNSRKFNKDGKLINNLMHLHRQFYKGMEGAPTGSREHYEYRVGQDKALFKKELVKSIQKSLRFYNQQGDVLSKLNNMKRYYDKNTKKLNSEGMKMVAEYTINNIVNGYNIADMFAPGIEGVNMAKRFKANSSPIFSVKNDNFKIEPIFVSDTINGNSISGSDGGMFITRSAAEKLKALGKGVFDMNDGFKLLNSSIEKDNPKFQGRMAYLKGYTTVIDEGHPFYKILDAREKKYHKYHMDKYGTEPSMDLADGTHNYMAIIIPESADKSNFIPNKLTTRDADGNLIYTKEGMMFTPDALSTDAGVEAAMDYYDNLFYNEDGFQGIQSYNFGPQQLMDKEVDFSNTPVQMVNSIIVNAALNGEMDLATEIQEHISEQKVYELQKILDKIKSGSMEDYKKLIMESLNTEDMNQVQRILLQDGGSLSHPMVNEIVVNQLAKTLRRKGNKLSTPGTYAHQKPDTGFNNGFQKGLRGYQRNVDNSLTPAEIVLPKHMLGKLHQREYFTHDTEFGKTSIKLNRQNYARDGVPQDVVQDDLNALSYGAVSLASKRFNVSKKEAEQYVKPLYRNDVHVGYYIMGDTVIASRVPGHGPSSTGVFEVVGFDQGVGNQVMISSEMNDILGSDNDGDALFIQMKGNEKEYHHWNTALDMLKDYWTSPKMSDQVTVKMDIEESTQEIVDEISKTFPQNKEFVFPFSPEQRMIDYNNTMVSKRNVGPIFNIHKITNMFAAYEIEISNPISINGTNFDQFKDYEKGENSRNQNSAVLANIILDNAKYGYADMIGLDEHNISQAVLLVNLGVPLVDVGKILNSKAAKLWSEFNRNNNSMFHDSKRKETIIRDIYKELGLERKKNTKLSINANKANLKSEQAAIIEMFSYLADMNSDVQKISNIMSGHNRIHVNPLALEKQLKDYRDVLNNKTESNTLKLSDEFKANPDMKNYESVAEETLKHLKVLNPVYRDASKNILDRLQSKIGGDMNVREIESLSNDLMKHYTSRLLGLNNSDPEYVKNLMDKKHPDSIFNKMAEYIDILNSDIERNEADVALSISQFHNSLLLRKALNMNTDTSGTPFISANPDFTNDSFNEPERQQAQMEFAELPLELQDDLILYDMITTGFKGPLSMAPFFPVRTNYDINFTSDMDAMNKNNDIPKDVALELERIIAIKSSRDSNNPFRKIYMNKNGQNPTNKLQAMVEIFKDPNLLASIEKGQPMYINVRKNNADPRKNEAKSALYEIAEFTDDEIKQVITERSMEQKRKRAIEIAKEKLRLVPDNLNANPDIDLSLIPDTGSNARPPYKSTVFGQGDSSLDPMTEATIKFEEAMQNRTDEAMGLDAREDFYNETFVKKEGLTLQEFNIAKEYKHYVSDSMKKNDYEEYLSEKKKANEIAESVNEESVKKNSNEQLFAMYEQYGNEDVYAYAIVLTPIINELANRIMTDQMALHKDIKFDGKDVSKMQAHMMSGSTIPSNHPASQGLARMLESEYKAFIDEKKKYIQETNKITDALYKERLGYGGENNFTSFSGLRNTFRTLYTAVTQSKQDVYERLYGNLVERNERLNENGKLVYDFKLRPVKDVNSDYERGFISKAEKDFYDHFRKTTNELMPKNMTAPIKADYVPHTAMSKFESLSARGLLGLLTNSRSEDENIKDVKLMFKNDQGEMELMNFGKIEDMFKRDSANTKYKNDINKILQYRNLKSKAKKLLNKGVNEDGSKIIFTPVGVDTALGFGAINRFSKSRSVKATEIPSMDLNKALSDYIHSSIFVNGAGEFKGMEKLQAYIDGVLAFNHKNNLPNMNIHVQNVWKDYFLRGKRQESFLGAKADKVIIGLTRMNLFYSLGYQANKNTGGLYAIGNIMAGKYHNIKDVGGKDWVKGELRYWGLDKGFKGGLQAVLDRHKRMNKIMKNINFMEVNVYDEVNMEKKNGIDAIFSDLALSPMILSEHWIQRVHMIGLLTDEQFDKFDDFGNYKEDVMKISNEELIELEDRVKSSHGRGYQPTDQRAVQMYSWGNMLLQFSKFIPTMMHDRFAKKDINIYGKENIGTLRAVGDMVRNVVNDPAKFVEYRKSLSPEARQKLDSGMKGMAMATVLSLIGATAEGSAGSMAKETFWDTNYFFNFSKLQYKMIPSAVQSTKNLVSGLF